MITKLNIRIPYHTDIETYLHEHHSDVPFIDYRILSQSLDARGASNGRVPYYQLSLELRGSERDAFSTYHEDFEPLSSMKVKQLALPIIVGTGPAGLFCALRLLEYGLPSILLERGDEASKRMLSISKYWRQGDLDEDSNVCFGEGGAGLFSDGKLVTRIKSPYVAYVMNRMAKFGAPAEVEWRSDPHVGSNKIRKIINNLSSYLKSKGVQIHYRARVQKILTNELGAVSGVLLADGRRFESPQVVLATGHGASDIYEHIARDLKVAMTAKPFAVGVRIEHPSSYINNIQYGKFAEDKTLGTAKYRLSHENKESKRGTYSFCMCPGGYILSSGTDKNGLVVNGMSNYARNSPWSNSALVVSVNPSDFSPQSLTAQQESALAGMYFQRRIEQKAFSLSAEFGASANGREIPAQTLASFLDGKNSKILASQKLPKNSCPSDIFSCSLDKILPDFVISHLAKALLEFERKLKGYASFKEALLLAPETRTSAPVTLLRNLETHESLSHQGLYPCGEGAGHAGGITSAAVDGVKVAESILSTHR